MILSCTRGSSGWILGKIILRKSGNASAQAAQGGGGVTISGGVQEEWRCGTKEHGQWAVLVVDGWLGKIILVAFSNPHDSVIL